jgi:hypothetical protein
MFQNVILLFQITPLNHFELHLDVKTRHKRDPKQKHSDSDNVREEDYHFNPDPVEDHSSTYEDFARVIKVERGEKYGYVHEQHRT